MKVACIQIYLSEIRETFRSSDLFNQNELKK